MMTRETPSHAENPKEKIVLEPPRVLEGVIDPAVIDRESIVLTSGPRVLPPVDLGRVVDLQVQKVTSQRYMKKLAGKASKGGPGSIAKFRHQLYSATQEMLSAVQPEVDTPIGPTVHSRLFNEETLPAQWDAANGPMLFHDHMGSDVFLSTTGQPTTFVVGEPNLERFAELIGTTRENMTRLRMFDNIGDVLAHPVNGLIRNREGATFEEALKYVDLELYEPPTSEGNIIHLPGDRYTVHAPPLNTANEAVRRSGIVVGNPLETSDFYSTLRSRNYFGILLELDALISPETTS